MADSVLDKNILKTDEGFKYINKRYAAALLATATLLLISQIVIQLTITNMKSDSRVVNISGRQRMLSQRITKCALGIYLAPSDEDRKRQLVELALSKDLWRKSHLGLRYGDEELGLPGDNSPEVVNLFETMQPHYYAIITAADTIVNKAGFAEGDRADLLREIRIMQEHERDFLTSMDKTVFQYDSESNRKMFHLQILEFSILFIALIVLAFEWRVVFKPAQREIKEGFDIMRKNEAYLTQLFETAPTITVLFDAVSLKVVKCNAMAVQLFREWLGVEVDGNTVFGDIFHGPGDRDLAERLCMKIRAEKEFSNLEVGLAEGKIVLLSAKTVESGGKTLYLVGVSDITTIKHIATFDSMTAMLNRRAGLELLTFLFEESGKNEAPLVICFIDIDRLKFVNDLYGHQEGDWYIKMVAATILDVTGERYKGLRYGGDELLLITEDPDLDAFEAKIGEIGRRLVAIGHSHFKPYTMSISHGFATYPNNDIDTVNEFIEEADMAMYEHKKAKRAAREA